MSNSHSLDLEASSSQYASIADASQTGLDLSGDHTIEAWVKMESLPSNGAYMMLVAKNGASGSFGYFWGIYNNGGTYELRGGISSNGTNFDFHSKSLSTFNTGTFYHVAVAFTASTHTAEFYKDGASLGTDTTGTLTSINNNNQAFYLGAINQGSPASFFDGLVDELKVYNDVRTTIEIGQDMYSSPIAGNNLQAYWSLNNIYTDPINSNTLTATGSPSFSTTAPFADYTGNSAFFAFM